MITNENFEIAKRVHIENTTLIKSNRGQKTCVKVSTFSQSGDCIDLLSVDVNIRLFTSIKKIKLQILDKIELGSLQGLYTVNPD